MQAAVAVLPRGITRLLGVVIFAGAIYGLVLGSWHGPRLAVYAAIKMPGLLIATAGITALFNWIVAARFAVPLRLSESFEMSLIPLAIAATVAASTSPALFLFSISLPEPSPAQRTVHNLFYLLHIAVLGGAGVAGVNKLKDALLTIAGGRVEVARRIRYAWLIAYAVTGGELAWALRPWIGSVYLRVVFIREDALHGNVYEFVITDILPHLLRRLFD